MFEENETSLIREIVGAVFQELPAVIAIGAFLTLIAVWGIGLK